MLLSSSGLLTAYSLSGISFPSLSATSTPVHPSKWTKLGWGCSSLESTCLAYMGTWVQSPSTIKTNKQKKQLSILPVHSFCSHWFTSFTLNEGEPPLCHNRTYTYIFPTNHTGLLHEFTQLSSLIVSSLRSVTLTDPLRMKTPIHSTSPAPKGSWHI